MRINAQLRTSNKIIILRITLIMMILIDKLVRSDLVCLIPPEILTGRTLKGKF